MVANLNRQLTGVGARIALLGGLCWLYGSLNLDRQMPAILADSVKSSFGLHDSQLGGFSGGAFAIVYALLGVHFGQLADRGDRWVLVRIGACLCAVSCMAAGFAADFPTLAFCRSGVALGEAVAVAASVSLMGELGGDRYRAFIAGSFFACAFVGGGMAAILGARLGTVGAADGWRTAMAVAGVPPIAGALYLSVIRRPKQPREKSRTDRDAGMVALFVAGSLTAVMLQIVWPSPWSVPVSVLIALAIAIAWTFRLRRLNQAVYAATFGNACFRWWLGSFCAVLFVDYAASFWLIPYSLRTFVRDRSSTGTQLGALMIGGGIVGMLLGGWVADRWRAISLSGRAWAASVAVLCEGVAVALAVHAPDYQHFILAFGAFSIAGGAWVGVAAAIGLDIVPAAHRGTGTAAYFLFTTLLGGSLGPFLLGLWGESVGLRMALTATTLLSVAGAMGLARLGFLLTRHLSAR
jgi:MFS family permease